MEGGLGFRSGPKTSLHLDPLWLLISFPRGRVWGGEPSSESGVWYSVCLCATAISCSAASTPALVFNKVVVKIDRNASVRVAQHIFEQLLFFLSVLHVVT